MPKVDRVEPIDDVSVEVVLESGVRFKIDREDLRLIPDRAHCVNQNSTINKPYIRTRMKDELLHRLIVQPPHGFHVDHINGDTLDNRKSNLRICTRSENNRSAKLSKNNTVGLKGVTYDKRMQKYYAQIQFNKKRMTLGYHSSPDDAHAAYVKAAKELFGEFAHDGKEPLCHSL